MTITHSITVYGFLMFKRMVLFILLIVNKPRFLTLNKKWCKSFSLWKFVQIRCAKQLYSVSLLDPLSHDRLSSNIGADMPDTVSGI